MNLVWREMVLPRLPFAKVAQVEGTNMFFLRDPLKVDDDSIYNGMIPCEGIVPIRCLQP